MSRQIKQALKEFGERRDQIFSRRKILPCDQHRDAGFTIFFMGISVGALFAPLACGYLAQRVG